MCTQAHEGNEPLVESVVVYDTLNVLGLTGV